MTIAAILDKKGRDVVTVASTSSVKEVVTLLADRKIGAVVVLDHGGEIAGILSERDVIANICREDDLLGCTAARIMSSPAVTVSSENQVLPALALMSRRKIRHLPVVDDGELVGIVSIGDLVQYRIDNMAAEAEAMREYIQAV
ncbi:CBS domain-containing protein [Sphingomicrobium clamense]|uniref:CBS domain-containing protein n=1 Tax=Sphingomicrobium clamense TaxID=2851013 RepID=A0ABS6V3P7_9SPHN|nr:CBS domain-containing protein [Sphingomicrobium sp. B8]MBW0143827.1 CBS domain-containing protein [Sphingomicrobium sp. B8]